MIRSYMILRVLFISGAAAAHHAATGRYAPDSFGEIEGEITDAQGPTRRGRLTAPGSG